MFTLSLMGEGGHAIKPHKEGHADVWFRNSFCLEPMGTGLLTRRGRDESFVWPPGSRTKLTVSFDLVSYFPATPEWSSQDLGVGMSVIELDQLQAACRPQPQGDAIQPFPDPGTCV